MRAGVNDRWIAEIPLTSAGIWTFHVEAWLDPFGGFVRDTRRKQDAGQPSPRGPRGARNAVAGREGQTERCSRGRKDHL